MAEDKHVKQCWENDKRIGLVNITTIQYEYKVNYQQNWYVDIVEDLSRHLDNDGQVIIYIENIVNERK